MTNGPTLWSVLSAIFYAEDNADSRELIVYMLEAADYHVTITTDPADALSQAQRERFDLILVDN